MLKLIQSNGQPHFGYFQTPPELINWRDYDLRSPMGRRLGGWAKWRRFHQFQYFGLISEQLIGGCALAQLSLLGVGFVYLFEPRSGRMIKRQFKLPLCLGTQFSLNPQQGVSELSWRGNRLRLENLGPAGEKLLHVRLDDGTSIEAAFSEQAPPFELMSLATPIANNGFVYAQKVAGVRCTGQVHCALGDFDLAASDVFAHHDWSAGYMRPETVWNWACLSGQVGPLRIGLNLSCGVNETSFSENCFWLDGALHRVSGVRFEFDQDQPLKPWQIHSNDGQVSLQFEGVGLHQERLNAGILASNFKQIFGRFKGELRPKDRPAIAIDSLWGFVEDQYVKW